MDKIVIGQFDTMAVTCPKCMAMYGLHFIQGRGNVSLWGCNCGYKAKEVTGDSNPHNRKRKNARNS